MTKRWVKLWCNDDEDSLTLEEDGFWSRLLKLAGKSPIEGVICVEKGMPYSKSQLIIKLRCSTRQQARLLKRFIELDRVEVGEDSTIIITNWAKYQSEYDRLKQYRSPEESTPESTEKSTTKGTPESTHTEYRIENIEDKNIYIDILNFWNSFKIIHHKALNDSTKAAIKSALKENTEYEICEAIKVYAEILQSDDCFFSYTWTLQDFLKRGLGKFLDGDVARKNYAQRKEKNGKGNASDPEEFYRRYGHLLGLKYRFVCAECDHEEQIRSKKPPAKDYQECPECHLNEFHWDGKEGT